jgi:isocitrate dehydrogenase (NAD+)
VSPRVTVVEGDGVGPEVIAGACRVLQAALPSIEFDRRLLGAVATAAQGTPIPDATIDAIVGHGVALKGPLASTPSTGVPASVSPGPLNVALRRRLGLTVQLRPVRSWSALEGHRGVDIVVARELTEDFAAGLELPAGAAPPAWRDQLESVTGGSLAPQAALTVRPISEAAMRPFLEFVFDWAVAAGRRRVTVAHKATVLRATDGLFVEVARDVATRHPSLECEDRLVDALAADLIRRPQRFDVIVAPFLYGDILSDVAAAVTGGLGLAPGANFGPGVAVFEAAHGTVPKHAGEDRADPLAAVLSGALMLRHLGEAEASRRVVSGVAAVLEGSDGLTYDLHARRATAVVGTRDLVERVIDAVTRAGPVGGQGDGG